MTDGSDIHVETRDHVVIIKLTRPAVRNAISHEIAVGIEHALDELEASPDLYVGVISAAGSAFSAGGDLKLLSEGRRSEMHTERGGFAGLVERARTKPLIAAVDGPAAGGGMEIALACDLIVASHRASFVLPEVKRALVAAAGGLFRAPRSLPWGVALEMLLTGDSLSAERAYQLGFVVDLCEAGQAEDHAVALALRIAANAPLSVQRTLREAKAALPGDDGAHWLRSQAAIAQIRDTEDAKEGPRAFLERRAPRWTGR